MKEFVPQCTSYIVLISCTYTGAEQLPASATHERGEQDAALGIIGVLQAGARPAD